MTMRAIDEPMGFGRTASRVLRFFVTMCLASCLLGACNGDDAAKASKTSARSRPVKEPAPAPVARVETADGWLDLIAQRPNAVLLRGGAVWIDLGQENARKHLSLVNRDGWILQRTIEGRAAGIVTGRGASLDLPLDGPLSPAANPGEDEQPGLAIAIELRALCPDQKMTVLWNERPLAHLNVEQTWQRRTLSLPPDGTHAGENRLRLHFRESCAVQGADASAAVTYVEAGAHDRITAPDEFVHPGEKAAGQADPVAPPVYETKPTPSGDTSLRLSSGSGLAWYFVPPRRGKLELDVRGRGGLSVRVSTDAQHRAGEEPKTLLSEPLRPTGNRSELDLTAWADTPVRLAIEVTGRDANAYAELDRVRVIARRNVPVDRRARKPRDIIILAVEGARADALAVGARPALPNLEGLMGKSVVFDRAYAPSPAAVPSHAAWLTSVVPPVHLTVSGTFVSSGQTSIAEALGRAGYARVLVSANSDVNEERGLLQGFDVHRLLARLTDDVGALYVVREAIDAIGAARVHDRRWLVYANVNDPQAPYEPPRDVLDDLEAFPGVQPHLTHIWVGRVRLGKTEPSKTELEYVRRLYRGELQMVDKALGELIEALRARDRLDDVIVVVMGVHGEEFFEHGGAGHGRRLFEESLRVPLIIHAPGLLAPGHVQTPIDLVDLAPTLADLVGLPRVDGWQGESLVPIIDDPAPPPRLVIGYLGDGSRAAVVGEHKYLLGPGRTERYFALGPDPAEQHDLGRDGGVGLRMVRSALAWQLAHEQRWRRARWGTGANLRAAFALDLGM